MTKDIQAAILRATGRFIEKRLTALEPRFKALEERVVLKGDPGKDADPAYTRALVAEAVAALPKPKDGESVSPEQVKKLVDEALAMVVPEFVGKAVSSLPHPEPGKDADPAVVQRMVLEAVAAIPRPANGTSVTVDDLLPVLKSMQAEWALDFERRAQALFQKAVEAIPKPENGKDGIGWDDMQVEHDGKRTVTLKFVKGDVQRVEPIVFPCTIDAGFFKDGQTYEEGDGVTFGGSYWIAQKDTNTKPEIGNPAWRLAVRRGRDGKRD